MWNRVFVFQKLPLIDRSVPFSCRSRVISTAVLLQAAAYGSASTMSELIVHIVPIVHTVLAEPAGAV